jgi:hypothetical protein
MYTLDMTRVFFFLYVHLHNLCAFDFFLQKKNIICGPFEKDKNILGKALFLALNFIFLYRTPSMSIFCEMTFHLEVFIF